MPTRFLLSLGVAALAHVLAACASDDKPAGPPDLGGCAYDGGGIESGPVDLGTVEDLGPFVSPELDAAMPMIPDLGPDYLLGCPKLTFCVSAPSTPTGLTWNNFGRDFFATYCTRCHGSTVTGTDRHGAPGGRDWDDRGKVNMFLPTIRDYVGVRMYMPFDEPWVLPCDRRRQLVTWIDEGAP